MRANRGLGNAASESNTHLGRHKFWRTAEGAGRLAIPHILLAKAVVCNLNVALGRKQNVVELEIAEVSGRVM